MNNILYDLGLKMSFAFEDAPKTKQQVNTDPFTVWDINLRNTVLTKPKPDIKEKPNKHQELATKRRLLN